MRIYDYHNMPNPLRVRIALAEKGLTSEIEFVQVDLLRAEHKQPAFLSINPEGTIPVLELEDGTRIAECTAITEYLDNLDANPVLTGITPKKKALVHMMQKRAERELLYAVGHYFHYGSPLTGAPLETFKQPQWEGRGVWGSMEKDRAIAGMHYFDNVLRESTYIAGDDYSMADITVWAGLYFAGIADINIPTECIALNTWCAALEQRPAFVAAGCPSAVQSPVAVNQAEAVVA